MVKDVYSKLEKNIAVYRKTVGRDMLRIYALLRDQELIDAFVRLIGWQGRPFFDQHVIDSPKDREQLFKGMTLRGWTDRSRFAHLLLDSYKRLYRDLYKSKEKLEDIPGTSQVTVSGLAEEEISISIQPPFSVSQ